MKTPKKLVKKPKVEKKPSLPKTSAANKLLEEKHIGKLTIDFSQYATPEQAKYAVYETLRHLSYFYDHKALKKFALDYCKKFEPKIVKALNSCEDWKFQSVGAWCNLMMHDAPLTQKSVDYVKNQLRGLAASVVEQKAVVAAESVSPAQRLKDKTSDFISEVESVIDDFIKGTPTEYSLYTELTKITAAPGTARAVVEYYKPLLAELKLVQTKKDEDLKYAYRNFTAKQLKEYIALIESIVFDAERYTAAKKAVRVTRKPKVRTASQQVVKLKLGKESAEYKITSVDAQQIVGAEKLFLFDTKYRSLIVMSSDTGFAVKGTSITNVTSSSKKKLRKPDEVLGQLLKTTKAQTHGFFEKIKSKASDTSTRVNENMILVKVYK